jgi:hypothetical protein
MDQRARAVEQDLKNILQTRLALSTKLDLLERQVREQVQGTKAALGDVFDHARSTAMGVIGEAGRRLNPVLQAELRPWSMIGSAVAVGFLVGWMDARRRASKVYRYYPAKAEAADVMPSEQRRRNLRGIFPFYPAKPPAAQDISSVPGRRPSDRRSSSVSSAWDYLTDELGKERDRLQGAAAQIGREFVQQVVRAVVPALIRSLTDTQGIRRKSLSYDPERPPQ